MDPQLLDELLFTSQGQPRTQDAIKAALPPPLQRKYARAIRAGMRLASSHIPKTQTWATLTRRQHIILLLLAHVYERTYLIGMLQHPRKEHEYCVTIRNALRLTPQGQQVLIAKFKRHACPNVKLRIAFT